MERNRWIDASAGAIAGAVIGFMLGAIWIHIAFQSPILKFDALILFSYPLGYLASYPFEFGIAWAIVAGSMLVLMCFGAFNSWFKRTTDYGDAHWQTKAEIRRNNLLDEPGMAFILAKIGKSDSNGKFLCTQKWPHVMMVAPTGAGKGVGFVIPNLLAFAGSTIVLDIKGENYEKTSRHRKHQIGDKVLRFDPLDAEGQTHRFNPLDQISKLENPVARYTELSRMAELYMQDTSNGSSGWIDGAKRLFIAGAILAIERETPTFGAILKIFQMPEGQKETLQAYASEVSDEQAEGIFNEYAGMAEKTLTSYLSILSNSGGLGLWSNPAVVQATQNSDWDFAEFRKTGHSLYICCTTNDLKALSPLIRLLFGQAVATLQRAEPKEDEPLPVMFMVDEFDQLGRMDIFVESMKTLRSFGGRVMIVTQSVPGLDDIYGENARMSLEAACGPKLYLTPQDPKTARELSAAIGKRTHLRKSVSRREFDDLGKGRNISLSEEERPLLSEQDARRLDQERIIILPAGQHPIMADRIKYYEDPLLSKLYEGQTGPLPHERSTTEQLALLTNKAAQTDRLLETANETLRRAEALADKVVSDRARFMEASMGESSAASVSDDTAEDGDADDQVLSVEGKQDAADLTNKISGLKLTRPHPAEDRPVKRSRRTVVPVNV
ncbi:MAG: type IV secretory system conjugative DNA transfer family protein [Pseudomonadota bacterium]